MKILLVQPPLKMSDWFGRRAASLPQMREPTIGFLLMRRCYTQGQPIALEAIAGCVPERHEVRILNLCVEPDDALERELAAFQPSVVGVSCTFTSATNNTLRTVQRIRAAAPNTFLVVGGHAPTMMPEHFDIEQVDAIAIGEGEAILPALLERLEGGREWRDLPGLAYRVNGALHRPASGPVLVDDLDSLPPLAHYAATHPAYAPDSSPEPVGAVYSSRGCPFRCFFCAVHKMYQGRYRCMSAERTVQEIESAPASLIGLLDASFLINVPHARDIAELLLERGVRKKYFFQARCDSIARHPDVIALWKEAGLNDVFVGLESADDNRLANMQKHSTVDVNRRAVEVLHRYDVGILAGMIIEPDFVEEDFDRLRRFVHEMKLDVTYFNLLTPYPGTDLWDQSYHQLTTHNWDYFDGHHMVLPTRLPLLRFYQLCFELAASASAA